MQADEPIDQKLCLFKVVFLGNVVEEYRQLVDSLHRWIYCLDE